MTYELAWKRELRSWDRFHIPLPFSRCRLITADPILVPADATDTDLAAIAGRVKIALGGN